LLIFRYFRII